MKKPAVFHPEAEAEFLAAIDFYGGKAGGLGDRFYQEIRCLVSKIETAPGGAAHGGMAPAATAPAVSLTR